MSTEHKKLAEALGTYPDASEYLVHDAGAAYAGPVAEELLKLRADALADAESLRRYYDRQNAVIEKLQAENQALAQRLDDVLAGARHDATTPGVAMTNKISVSEVVSLLQALAKGKA